MSRVAWGTIWFARAVGLLFSWQVTVIVDFVTHGSLSRSQRLASMLPLSFAGPQDCFGRCR